MHAEGLRCRVVDVVQVLGMEHKLHVRKVILARAKLTPLSDEELARKVRQDPC